MTDLDNKIRKLIEEFNIFRDTSIGRRYWLDLRCLILLSHLYIEYLLDKLLIKNKVSNKIIEREGFKWKIDKLFEKKILNPEVYNNLKNLNNARNIIGHNLNIISKLNNIHQDYLDIKTTKINTAKLFCSLLDKIEE